jgi:thiol-disulfide isomerase/thioredoxin
MSPHHLAAVLLAAAVSFATGCASSGSAPPPATPPAKVAALNTAPGAMVDVEKSLPPGVVTVVDFWAEWCVACKTVEAQLLTEIADHPDIVLRKVDVGSGDSAVSQAYKIGGLPHLRIFDRRGRLRYMLVGDDATTAGEAAKKLSAEK